MDILLKLAFCEAVLVASGLVYVIFFRDSLLTWVSDRVDLVGAVTLPDRVASFHDKVALSILISFIWPGEIYRILSIYRKRKGESWHQEK